MRLEPVALLRDTGRALYLDGAQVLDELYSGTFTKHRIPTREYVTQAYTDQPYQCTVQALVGVDPLGLAVPTKGLSRWAEVEAWLDDTRRARALVTLQRPGRSSVPSLVVESYAIRQSATSALEVSVSLIEARIARATSITLAPRPATPPKAPGVAAEQDKGTRQTSLLKGGVNSVQDLLTAGRARVGI